MSELWRRWEGQVIDHKYRLESLIGSTDHSVVFRAECLSPQPGRAALKFVSADIPNADQLVDGWHKAAQLSHPNLQRILQTGKCTLEDMDLLYVATEYADENLAEIIPQRALTMEEAREVLNSLVDVLVYLHGKELTHGHVCPANIVAVGEFLKVSSDTIEPLAEKREMTRERSEYDAPEIPGSPYSKASDAWSLGVTLVEMLTQERATLPFDEDADPVIPPSVREPFLEIASHTLRKRPGSRWTSAQIAERLNRTVTAAKAAAAGSVTPAASVVAPSASSAPTAAGKAAATQAATTPPVIPATPPPAGPTSTSSLEPLSVPLSKEPAVPLAKQPRRQVPSSQAAVRGPKPGQREALVLPNYALPLLFVALLVIGAMVLPKILRNETKVTPDPVRTSTAPKSAPAVATTEAAPAEERGSESNAQKKEDRVSAAPAVSASTVAPAPAVLRTSENAPSPKAKNSAQVQGRGEVLEQALPQVSAKALSTVTGTVRVVVKAHVDGAGQVTAAELQETGPSQYFADKAVQAAQRWLFTSPEANGRSIESDWVIRFEYTHEGVKAFAEQVAN